MCYIDSVSDELTRTKGGTPKKVMPSAVGEGTAQKKSGSDAEYAQEKRKNRREICQIK